MIRYTTHMFRVVASSSMPIDIRPILSPNIALITPDTAGKASEQGIFSRAELLERSRGADALITLLSVNVDQELFDAVGDPRLIANFAVGTDNIDIELATQRGIVVTNTPDVLTEATADFTFALLLASARRLLAGDQLARSGTWAGWHPQLLLGSQVFGQTLGIIGMGRIGRAVAARARGFGMKIIYSSPRKLPLEQAAGAAWVSVDQLACESDFVALHCPLTDATHHLVNANFLAAMKPTAHLVNTARGGCVDTDALVAALTSGQIAGAGLDVFANEPNIDFRLRSLDNVILAPHAGSATIFARTQMATICAQAVRTIFAGECPPTAINPQALDIRARRTTARKSEQSLSGEADDRSSK